MPVWMHKPRALFLNSVFFFFYCFLSFWLPLQGFFLFSPCQRSSSPSSIPLPKSERNVYEPSLESWPEPPCPTSPSPNVFFFNPPVSVQEQNWPTLNISYSPTRQPPPSSRSLAQPMLPVCCAVLCSTRSSALSAGDRLFGIYPLLLCLSLHLQPFSWQ